LEWELWVRREEDKVNAREIRCVSPQ
jgi:hypothetical protein